MVKDDWKAIIKDEKEIAKLEIEFCENRKKIEKKIYTSVTEERLRTIKIVASKKIQASVEQTFQAVINRVAQDMHPSLTFQDLALNTFYRTSKKSSKIPFKITELNQNEVITIEYYTKDQQFIRTLQFKSNKTNTKTKITYIDVVTGMTSILGWFERHIRGVYIKRQIIAFKNQILNAQLDLNLIPNNKKVKVEKEIARMIKYAQDSF